MFCLTNVSLAPYAHACSLTAGPLMNLATQVIFDGVPTYPDAGRCWQIVDKYQVGE
jgi:acyl-coenzyme A synthetase/AMP-(fatty) acid ligase